MMRAVIFAAVSTEPQVGRPEDPKESIPSQIKAGRAVIDRHGWSEVHPPLVVPGESRSILFLHDATREVDALGELVSLARSGEIDLVVCRDYDRLARTRALLTQISSYLTHCQVQIYAYDKPVEPVPAGELGNRARRRAVRSAATVEAFAGLEAEGEVDRIVERRYTGMNANARAGRWNHPKVAYGYTRVDDERSTDNQTIYLDVPVQVPNEITVVKRIERMFLKEMKGTITIARELNLEGVPSPTGLQWRATTIRSILRNPFYTGWIVWGKTRKTKVVTESGEVVSRRPLAPAVQELEDRLGRKPNLFDFIESADKLNAGDVIVAEGQHDPSRTMETHRAICNETKRRRERGGRAVSTAGSNPLPFSGLLICGGCGSTMTVLRSRKHDRIYYRCRLRQMGGVCDNKRYIRENVLTERVLGVLSNIASTPGAVDQYLADQDDVSLGEIEAECERITSAIDGLSSRRSRWDDAYEAGAINLEAYQEKIGSLSDEKQRLDRNLISARQRASRVGQVDKRRERIESAVSSPQEPADRSAFKTFLHRLIDHIVVKDADVTRIVFR